MCAKFFYSKTHSINGLTYNKKITVCGIKIKHHLSNDKYIKSKYYQKEQENLYIEISNKIKKFKKIILYYDHSLGGGTETYFNNQLRELPKEDVILRIQYFLWCKCYKLSINGACKYVEVFDADLEHLTLQVQKFGIDEIILNNIVGYPSVTDVFNSIKILKNKNQYIRTVIMGHDYFSICPNYNLFNCDNEVCDGVYNESGCLRCYEKLNKQLVPKEVKNGCDIKKWHNMWADFAKKYADEIRCFSPSSKIKFERNFVDCTSKITLVPHKFVPFKNTVNVAVIGNFSPIKGSNIVIKMLEYLEDNNLWDIQWFLYGNGSDWLRGNPRVGRAGHYERNALPELLKNDGIDLIFIPSVCDETFSYTTQEAIAAGYPVMSFNLGGQADQVKNYDKGVIINSREPADIYKEIEKFYAERINNNNEKICAY